MMLTPEELNSIPNSVYLMYNELSDYILSDICRRIAKVGVMTDTAAYETTVLTSLGEMTDTIKTEIKRVLNKTDKEIEYLFYAAAQKSIDFDNEVYKRAGFPSVDFKNNEYIQNILSAQLKQTKNDMHNYTQSLGFAHDIGGKRYFKPIASSYQYILDIAHMQIISSAVDTTTAIKSAVDKLARSGLRYVDYASGHINRLDVAVRRATLTGISQVVGKIAEHNADDIGVTTMQITAHSGARPTHANWQGKIVDRSGKDKNYLTLEDIGYGTVTGFKGANCYHDWFVFIPGFSEPLYTKDQLNKLDPPPFEYNGKEYNYYKAMQKQRQIETSIRESKRKIIAYDAADLKNEMTIESINLKNLKKEYDKFTKSGNLTDEMKMRTQVFKYGKSTAQRAAYLARTAN